MNIAALQQQAQNLLHIMQEDPILQLLSNHISHETTMTCSTQQLHTLVHHCAQQIQVYLKAAHQQAVLQTHNIHRFF